MKNLLNEIPAIFPGQFPVNYKNDLNGWNFTKKEIKNNKGKILTMDIDLGDRCSLNCPHCFRRTAILDRVERKMTFDETINIVKEAKMLGLRSVKFLGSGEPFENMRFVEFLRFLKSIDVIPIIFTKGHVIGDDKLAKKFNGHYGINNGFELIDELKRVNASICLGFNSFNPHIQDRMVGEIKGYTQKRDAALLRLINSGFNKTNPTRVALIISPITKLNYDEIFNIYKWSRERNLYPITTTTMVGGRASNWNIITPSKEKLKELYVKIYKFNLERGIQTLEQLKKEGISSYAGAHPCNQVACGMYITLSGKVLRCPGDDVTILGDIFAQSLEKIWVNSENFRRSGKFNCGCPPKIGKSIPNCLFRDVIKTVSISVH